MTRNSIVAATTLSLILFFAILVGVTVWFATRKTRAARIAYLRSFKKGQCALVFLAAIPLYTVGALYTATEITASTVISSIFTAVSEIIGLVVLKFDSDVIGALANADDYFRGVLFVCYVLVVLNAVMFTLSLCGQRFWEFRKRVQAFFTHKDKLIIFGYNEANVEIYASAGINKDEARKDKKAKRKKPRDDSATNGEETSGETKKKREKKKYNRMIIGDVGGDGVKLYADKVAHRNAGDDKAIDGILGGVGKRPLLSSRARRIAVVINTGDDERNIALCRKFADRLKDGGEELRERCFDYLEVYVFGSAEYEAIYLEIVDNGYGCIRYKNRYEMMALDFIDRYPLALFMDDRQVDRERALVKDGVDINVFLVGFGKFNRRVLLTSVASNQFVRAGKPTKRDPIPDPIPKLVNYYVYDKDEVHNKNLNHNYYRYMRERAGMDNDSYLPLPDSEIFDASDENAVSYYPANKIVAEKLDINNGDFYNNIRSRLKSGADGHDANFIVIAFGSDLENIDLARKLVEKRKEWGAEFTVFVKVVNGETAANARGFDVNAYGETPYYIIADERKTVYNIDKITMTDIYKMTLARHDIYTLENSRSKKTYEDFLRNSKKSRMKWYIVGTQIERDSNLFAVLHIRSKLNLMGLDYCKKDEKGKALSFEEYYEKYDRDNEANWNSPEIPHPFKVEYELDFARGSLRRALAALEHQRWNAYMISKGMVPASKEQIATEKADVFGIDKKTGELGYKYENTCGKNYKMRRHGNITTFAELETFRDILVKNNIKTADDADVIRYDYQVMDELWQLLDAHGFKIIEKQPVK